MRPAWAHSCGCKSRRKLITANEVKRNCVRVTERGEEAWSISCEPMDKNRIEGVAEQSERARNREALMIKAKRRKSGGCAAKECVLTRGDLALWLKGRRGNTERGVSSGHSSCLQWAKGQGNRRRCPTILGNGLSQMFASAKLANRLTRVKPEARRQRETEPGGSETSSFRRCAEFCRCVPTSTIPTARCGPACRVVREGSAR